MTKMDLNRFKYLVVDDDSLASDLLGSTLNHLGAQQIGFAVDGPNALRLAQQQRPDFILLDLYLPEVDGWALLEQLRRVAPQAAVVMVTGSHLTADFRQPMQQRADGYCIKPVMPDLMEKALHNARKRKSAANASLH